MAGTRTWGNVLMGLAAVALAAACSDSADGALYGSSSADSVSADLSVAQDSAGGDSASAPDGAAGDSAADSAQDAQAAADPSDIVDAKDDTAALDTVADVGADAGADAAPDAAADTAKPDTAADVAPDAKADTADTSADPCAVKLSQFADLKAKALACATPFDCYQGAAADGKCQTCQRHYNGKSADTQNLVDMSAVLLSSGCGAMCGSGCANMATQVGVCSAGQCATKELSCKELDVAASAALAEGAKCKADSDCAFKVSNTLGCGCPTFVNITTMGPGKPLFNYMKMLVLAYKAKVCVPETSCACPDPNSAKCVAGVCVAQ